MSLSVARLWYRRCESLGQLLLVSLLLVALTVLNLPVVGYLALGTLEWRYPPDGPRSRDSGAIVVLSGDLRPPDAVRPRAELGQDSLYRCIHAAELYRRSGPCPVLVSGGKVDPHVPGPTLARAMGDFLRELGVRDSDIGLEEHSRTTHENAVETARLLRGRGIARVVLVTEAYHMPRALRCFRKQRIEVIPSACHHRATEFRYSLSDFLPSPTAALHCQLVVHEWLGMVWYWLLGRI